MTRAHGGRPIGAQRDRWIVSYADLMTLLFAVFVVLFTAARKTAAPPALTTEHLPSVTRSSAQSRQVAETQDAVARRRQALYERLNNVLAPALKTRVVSLQQLPDGVVVRLNEAGTFRRADATPLPSVGALLHGITAATGPAGAAIRVEGHTDDQPIHTAAFRSNWELSTARAQAVLFLLLADPGVDPAHLSVAGYGAYHPIAGNDTDEGRRLNRRVDLVVTPLAD